MKKNEKLPINDLKAIRHVVLTTGVSSVVTQLLTIREFLVQFSGNEFVIALILFSWLALGGAGTLLAQRVSGRGFQAKINRLCGLSLFLTTLSVAHVLAIRLLRNIFFTYGVSIGFYPTFTYIVLIISPYCIILGFVLPYSLFVIRQSNPEYSGTRLYMTDNLGDVFGGVLFSFVLVYFATPMQALFISGVPLILAVFLLYPRATRFNVSFISGIFLTISILVFGMLIEYKTLSPPHGNLVHYRESRFGRVEIHQDREQFTLFIEGVPLFSNQNLSIAEEAIHYPLSQIEKTGHVLIISPEGNMVEEIEKHQPQMIDYIEIDPEVSRSLFNFGLIQESPILRVIHRDGKAYLKKTKKFYDAIIINLPEPETFQINRFFTDSFFNLVKTHLSGNSIFSFSMEGFDNYVAEPQRQKLSSLYNTAKLHFKHVLMLPGQKIFFLCSQNPVQSNIPELLDKKNISTSYIESFFYGNLTHERILELNKLVDSSTPINTDTEPYLMRIMFLQWFTKFSTSPEVFFIALLMVFILYLLFISKEEFVLFSTGYATMGNEIIVIFAFQTFYGYIYLQIGIIVTVFLAGLLPGAWLGEKLLRQKNGKSALALTDSLMIVLMGLLLFMLIVGGDNFPVSFYMVFGFLVSVLCGCQFPLALRLKGDKNTAVTRFFSADLMGAALGTLITSVVLIPYAGILWTITGLMGLKLVSVIIMVWKNGKRKQTAFSIL